MRDSVALAVTEPSQAGEARRLASALAGRAGFDETGRARVALVAAELANNLVRHAVGGELVISAVASGGVGGVEVLAIDRGPGMLDFRRCLVDGYSTGGTPGTGLGAVDRAADEFDAHSAIGQGSAILARLWASPPRRDHPGGGLRWGGICLPVRGEQECGDAWAVAEEGPLRWSVIVADGLGHGPLAAAAADAAIDAFRRSPGLAPAEIVRAVHEALKGSRGAAVAVASVDRGDRRVRFCGVGNVAATILGPGARQGLVSHGGTAGVEMRKVQEFAHPWPDGSILVMHTDGLTSHWKLDRGSPLSARDPSLIAGVLYRDFARDRDDSTAVVARDGEARP